MKTISVLEQRERSQGAMRSLYSAAWSQIKNGVSGELPHDEILAAKDFFYNWRARKPIFENNTLLMVFALAGYIVFFFTGNGDIKIADAVYFLVPFAALEFIFFLLEKGKSKRTYIREMLGDLDHLKKKEKELFLRGLLYELWRVDEKYKIKSIVFANVLILSGLVFGAYLSEQGLVPLLGVSVSIVGVLWLGMSGFIEEERVGELE